MLYLGGNFTTVGTTGRLYLAKVNATTGAAASPIFSRVGDVILDLSVSSDGASVFGAGGGGFNSAAGWSVTTGQRRFAVRADGDTQAVQYSNSHVYMGFHDGFRATSACACWRWRRPTARSIRRSTRAPTATLACTAWTLTGAIWWLVGTSPTWAVWV